MSLLWEQNCGFLTPNSGIVSLFACDRPVPSRHQLWILKVAQAMHARAGNWSDVDYIAKVVLMWRFVRISLRPNPTSLIPSFCTWNTFSSMVVMSIWQYSRNLTWNSRKIMMLSHFTTYWRVFMTWFELIEMQASITTICRNMALIVKISKHWCGIWRKEMNTIKMKRCFWKFQSIPANLHLLGVLLMHATLVSFFRW